jgi:hypothetical protein
MVLLGNVQAVLEPSGRKHSVPFASVCSAILMKYILPALLAAVSPFVFPPPELVVDVPDDELTPSEPAGFPQPMKIKAAVSRKSPVIFAQFPLFFMISILKIKMQP